jgi:hypothetical protein
VPVNLGQLVATTLFNSKTKLTDEIFVGTRTLKVLSMKDGFKDQQRGGTDIRFPLEYRQNTNVRWGTDTDNYSIAAQDPFDTAIFNWRMLMGTVPILRSYEIQNDGKHQIVKLVEALKKNLTKTLRYEMNEMLFNAGTDPVQPIGLRAIVSTTGTYGSIARSGNTWWQGQVDSTAEILSITDMDHIWELCSESPFENTAPAFTVTTMTLFEKYMSDARQFLNINMTRNGDLGFESITYRGKPLFWDTHCPSGHMFMLNPEYLHLVCHPEWEYKVLPEITTDQPVKIIPVEWHGTLACDGPRYQGLLSGKTAS